MDANQRLTLSKVLSWALRHEPEALGLSLDAEGWVSLDALAVALREGDRTFGALELHEILAQVDEVVVTNPKQRFEVVDGRIRARQGHSVPVDLGLHSSQPPERLYHGTARPFLSSILASGLRRQSRHHVHLSPDPSTARRVGRRHGHPVVLQVDAARLHAETGATFFLTDNGVWLTEQVPPDYLMVED